MCCLHSQCSTGQIQVDSPTSNRLLPLERAPSPLAFAPVSAAAAAVPPSASDAPPTHPHRSTSPPLPPNPPNCESCIYRVCGCRVPPPSDPSTAEMESSLDVDLTDPRVVQALTIFGGGDVRGHDDDDVIDLTPNDIDDRLNRIDFVSAYFRNYGHRRAATAKDEFNPDYSTRNPDRENLPPTLPITLRGGLISSPSSPPIRHGRWSPDDVSSSSSSLPSSFRPDHRRVLLLPPRRRRRLCLLAPTNSPVSGRCCDPSLSPEEDRGGDGVLPERLRKEFSHALGFLFDGGKDPENRTSAVKRLRSHQHQQQHSRRKARRTSVPLGDRPPCLGQEQSPVRDSSPRRNYTAPLSTVRPRGLRFPLESRPPPTEDTNGGETRTAWGLPSLAFRPPKSSAEKVRRWLLTAQQEETRPALSCDDDSCHASSSGSSLSTRNFHLNHPHPFHRPKIRSCPAQRCYNRRHYAPETEKPDRDPEEEETQDRRPVDEEEVFLLHRIQDDVASSPPLPKDEISSSGFLADRSSTTRSSLRTASDHVSPSYHGPHDSNPEHQSGAKLLGKV